MNTSEIWEQLHNVNLPQYEEIGYVIFDEDDRYYYDRFDDPVGDIFGAEVFFDLESARERVKEYKGMHPDRNYVIRKVSVERVDIE